MVRHRVGRPTLLGRHNFDPSASLHINRSGPVEGMPSLVLHHRGSDEGLCIARGPNASCRSFASASPTTCGFMRPRAGSAAPEDRPGAGRLLPSGAAPKTPRID
jgi:hypothetical protein